MNDLDQQEQAEREVCDREYASRMRDLDQEERRSVDNALRKELRAAEIKEIQRGFQDQRRRLTERWESRRESIRGKYARQRMERRSESLKR